MMNIKNIFFTTGVSIFFGLYSVYKIFDYIQQLEIKHHNQVNNLNILLNDTFTKYENLKYEYLNLREEIINLNNKINELEQNMKPINDTNNLCHISSEDSLKLSESSVISDISNSDTLCDILCDLNGDKPLLYDGISDNSLNSVNIYDSMNKFYNNNNNNNNNDNNNNNNDNNNNNNMDSSCTDSLQKLSEIFSDDPIIIEKSLEIINRSEFINNTEQLKPKLTNKIKRTDSFCSSATATSRSSNSKRKIVPANEINWIYVAKKFIFG